MKARLDHLDASGLELRVGDTVHATLGAMAGLRGELVQDGTQLAIDRAAARRAEVSELDLRLGKTIVAADRTIAFDQLRGSLRHGGPGDLRCELRADRADGLRLRLGVGELVVTGRVALTSARLRIDGEHGAVFAEQVVLGELVVELPGTKLEVETLEGVHVAIEWSPSGIDAEFAGLRSRAVHAAVRGLRITDLELAPSARAA